MYSVDLKYCDIATAETTLKLSLRGFNLKFPWANLQNPTYQQISQNEVFAPRLPRHAGYLKELL